eukprot:COSAG03_NODE_574_length_6896_cov_8.214948_2_plen_147_part_00
MGVCCSVVCFNTVAILFLADIGNLPPALLLPERMRARIEEAGRTELNDVEALALARTKTVHTTLALLAVLSIVMIGGAIGNAINESGFWAATICVPFLVFWAAGVVEAFGMERTVGESSKEIAKTTGAWLLGAAVSFMLYILSIGE